MQNTRNRFASIIQRANDIRGARVPKGPQNDARLEGLDEGMKSDSSRGAIARLDAEHRSNIFGGKG